MNFTIIWIKIVKLFIMIKLVLSNYVIDIITKKFNF